MTRTQKQKYEQFLISKINRAKPVGFDRPAGEFTPGMFDFQMAINQWALRCGRAAIFAGTGMGKTIMSLDWAKAIAQLTGKPVLILAPLAVSAQTIREGKKFGIEVTAGAFTPGE